MTFLMGLVLILATLFWLRGLHYEWSIPLKWEAYIGAWKELLSNKSHSLYFVWEVGPENGELEKRFWYLQRELPGLQKNYKHPLWIEVQIKPISDVGQKAKYMSCLQRRFSKIRINECPLHGQIGNGEQTITAERG